MLSTVFRHTPKSVDLDLDSIMRGPELQRACFVAYKVFAFLKNMGVCRF